MALTGLALSPQGTGGLFVDACRANAQLVFTNIRVLPCLIDETVRRYATTATAVVNGSTGAAGGGTVTEAKRIVGGSFGEFRDGFTRVARSLPEELNESRDGRILAQVGAALGFVYLGFLTVWFWATRLRWNPRA
jgi:hypothetical protein